MVDRQICYVALVYLGSGLVHIMHSVSCIWRPVSPLVSYSSGRGAKQAGLVQRAAFSRPGTAINDKISAIVELNCRFICRPNSKQL